MSAFFVTSCGTGVGKTLATATLCKQLRERSQPVNALKPIISGYTPETAMESDTQILLRALGRELSAEAVDTMSPWRFIAPLSPHIAAAREGRAIDFDQLVDFCRRRMAAHDGITLIEGVGGVMAPLTPTHTVLDWIAALGIPALLVVGSYLGSLSHSLTAAAALMGRNIPVQGVIISESDGATVSLDDTTATLRNFMPTVPIISIPHFNCDEDIPELSCLIC